MMTQTLIPTEMINDGAAYGTEFHLPKGIWMTPNDRRVAFAYSWHFLVSSWTALWRGLSRSYFGRGYLVERFADSVYGVVLVKGADGLLAADAAATEARRTAIRKDRLAKAVPTAEWMQGERDRILKKEAGVQVQQMFAASTTVPSDMA